MQRRLCLTLCSAVWLCATLPVRAQGDRSPADPLSRRCAQIAAEIVAQPADPTAILAPSFVSVLPAPRVVAVFRQEYEQYGSVTGVEVRARTAYRGTFELSFSKGYQAALTLVVDPADPHRISGLLIGPATPQVGDLGALAASFGQLPGRASFFACRLGGNKPVVLAQYHPDRELAIGSAFKLFVLGALVDEIASGRRKWTDLVRIRQAWKSLPSGILQSWPARTPLTLQSVASLMISMSDNTAADLLIHTLGRERVEAQMRTMGVRPASRGLPLLTTREMMLLKGWHQGHDLPAYVAMSPARRLEFLRDVVDRRPLDSTDTFGAAGKPVAVEQVEWFASTRELAGAMDWLRRHTGSARTRPAREILTINPGLAFDRETWPYVGFKGGSEPGVLDLTYLLRSRSGTWYALSASWTDPDAPVDTQRLAGLVRRAAQLLANTPTGR